MIYWKYNYIKKSYNFNIKLNYDFKTWKNQANATLAMVHVIVTTPKCIWMLMENLDHSPYVHLKVHYYMINVCLLNFTPQ